MAKQRPRPQSIICSHPEVDKINEALLRSEPFRAIAKRFGVSVTTLHRYKHNYLPAELSKAHEAAEITRADNLLEQVQELQAKAINLLNQAEAAGDLRTALTGVREARACIELLAKIQGELQQEGTVNITLAPQWVELRTLILQSLRPWPEARLALAQAVKEVEGNVK